MRDPRDRAIGRFGMMTKVYIECKVRALGYNEYAVECVYYTAGLPAQHLSETNGLTNTQAY